MLCSLIIIDASSLIETAFVEGDRNHSMVIMTVNELMVVNYMQAQREPALYVSVECSRRPQWLKGVTKLLMTPKISIQITSTLAEL